MKPYKVYSRACTDWELCMALRGAPRQRQNEVLEYELLAQSEAMSEAMKSLQPAHIGGKYDVFTGRII